MNAPGEGLRSAIALLRDGYTQRDLAVFQLLGDPDPDRDDGAIILSLDTTVSIILALLVLFYNFAEQYATQPEIEAFLQGHLERTFDAR
jgi:hypothetical protein